MKKGTGQYGSVLRIILCVLFLASVILSPSIVETGQNGESVSKRKDISIKSRTLTAPADRAQAVRAVTRIAPGERKYIIIQLGRILDAEEREALEASGIRLLQYINNHGWYAVAEGGLDQSSPALEGVVGSWSINAEDRMTPGLNRGEVPAHAIDDAGLFKLKIIAFDDADLDSLVKEIESLGGTVDFVTEPFKLVFVTVSDSVLKSLAELEGVMWIEPVAPRPQAEMNRARTYLKVNYVQTAPYDLTGSGVTVSVHEQKHAYRHIDIYNRYTVGDATTADADWHPTNTAGTIAGDGTGNSSYKGMATGADIVTYKFGIEGSTGWEADNYGDIADALSRGVDVSNNSWGRAGCIDEPYGDYTTLARVYDRQVLGMDSLGNMIGEPMVVVFSAGNERDGYGNNNSTDCIDNTSAPYANYGTMNQPKPAKNIIAVGAVDAANSRMASYSSWGPVDDGRIKPDIVAAGHYNGTYDSGITYPTTTDHMFLAPYYSSQYPNTNYGYFGMTSAAAAMVSGNAALFIEDFKAQNTGGDPKPSTVKAHFIHTARDLDDSTTWYNPGPDYASGHGVLDIKKAIDQMRAGGWIESCVDQGQTDSIYLPVPDGTSEVKVTLVWDDVPGAPGTTGPALVNDLDLVVTDAGVRKYPWTLNPASPSSNAVQTSEDHLNNVEVVQVTSGITAGNWVVKVKGTSVPSGPQCYSLVFSPVSDQSCFGNSECATTDYCRTVSGNCGLAGACATEPSLCKTIYSPVCGCDSNSYYNSCYAAGSGVSVDHSGVCNDFCNSNTDCDKYQFCLKDIEQCNGQGKCVGMPLSKQCLILPKDPVCGCNGKTYDNACYMVAEGVSGAYMGQCKSTCKSNLDCIRGDYCYKPEGSCGLSLGTCMQTPSLCLQEIDYVCGCNGVTYTNACIAAAKGVTVDHKGKCVTVTDADGDGYASDVDCDDNDPFEHPGQTWYKDSDNDGFSDGTTNTISCERPEGYKIYLELEDYQGQTLNDCDDYNSTINALANEACNQVDDNCDGNIDEGLPTQTYYSDDDEDGYGDDGVILVACGAPSRYWSTRAGDCDDSEAGINPGMDEFCNNRDDNCNGNIDENLTRPTTCGVGECAGNTGEETCTAGQWGDNTCDSTAGAADEVCDGKDNDCNGEADEGLDTDADGDGHYPVGSCGLPADDCDDSNKAVYPGAKEICDGIDNNCDGILLNAGTGLVTNGDGTITDTDIGVMYLDASYSTYDWYDALKWIDGLNADNHLGHNDWRLPLSYNFDGSGPCSGMNCSGSEMGHLYYAHGVKLYSSSPFKNLPAEGFEYGFSPYWSGTGADSEAWIFAFHSGDQHVHQTPYTSESFAMAVRYESLENDSDGDGFVECTISGVWAGDPAVVGGDDCNDSDNAVHPGVTEGPFGDLTCTDTKDNDCDGATDAADSGCQALDNDGDGYASDVDCDDTDSTVHPGAAEVCDGKDNDCNGEADEGLRVDNDGDGRTSLDSCGGSQNDCDDNDNTVHPNAPEYCDNKDNDCDGAVDEELTRPTTCGLGVCAGNAGTETCTAGAWGDNSCDPLAGAVNEICTDTLDNDCDGSADTADSDCAIMNDLVTGMRDLPAFTAPDSFFDVFVEIDVDETNVPNSLIVEEFIPAGWTLVSADPVNVSFDTATGKIKWLFLSLVGNPVQDMTITYRVQVPATETVGAVRSFSGKLSYTDPNENDLTTLIDGKSDVTIGYPAHACDESSNWAIEDFELLHAIDKWVKGEKCGDFVIGDFDLLHLIDYWVNDEYCWNSVLEDYRSGAPDEFGACQ